MVFQLRWSPTVWDWFHSVADPSDFLTVDRSAPTNVSMPLQTSRFFNSARTVAVSLWPATVAFCYSKQKTTCTMLYCVEWHNTLFARSSQLSMQKLLTYCIRRCLVSRACDWVMSALSAAWLIFSFQFSLLFFNITVARPHQHCGVLLILIRNIGHKKFCSESLHGDTDWRCCFQIS